MSRMEQWATLSATSAWSISGPQPTSPTRKTNGSTLMTSRTLPGTGPNLPPSAPPMPNSSLGIKGPWPT